MLPGETRVNAYAYDVSSSLYIGRALYAIPFYRAGGPHLAILIPPQMSAIHPSLAIPSLYFESMPRGLHRYQQSGDLHFLTFSCHRRLPYLAHSDAAELFQTALEWTRKRYRMSVLGYVVMPENVHLAGGPGLGDAGSSIKVGVPQVSPLRPGRAIPPTRPIACMLSIMPCGLARYQQCGCLHFLTFSCYHRQAYLNTVVSRVFRTFDLPWN